MKCFLATIVVFFNLVLLAQNISFLTPTENYKLIYGTFSRIILQSKNDSCRNYFLKSENAYIIKENCDYLIVPQTTDAIYVGVYKINKGDTLKVEESKFHVRDIVLQAKIGGISGGKIRKNVFKVQRGVIVSVDNSITPFSGDIRFSIIEHSILILRNGNSIYQETLQGVAFSQELKNKLQDIQANDRIFLYDVKAKGPDGSEREVAPVIFEMID